MAAVARYLADTSALARLRHASVAEVLGPLIESGLVATCGVIEFELAWATSCWLAAGHGGAGRVVAQRPDAIGRTAGPAGRCCR